MMIDDMELVRRFARDGSEEAFADLVSRHVDLVYSVSLRQTHDAHLAEEVTQTVFVILARKAGSLGGNTVVAGWLCRTARFVSARALTMQRRRQEREQEAFMQSQSTETESDAWKQIEPLLEASLQSLLWGASTGDLEKFLAGFTAEERERFRDKVLAGKSPEEIRERAIALANATAGYRITQRVTVSDDEVHLHIAAPPSDAGLPSGQTVIFMKRIGREWKRSGSRG